MTPTLTAQLRHLSANRALRMYRLERRLDARAHEEGISIDRRRQLASWKMKMHRSGVSVAPVG